MSNPGMVFSAVRFCRREQINQNDKEDMKATKARKYFGSLAEMQDFIRDNEPLKENVENGRIFSEMCSESFTGTPNFEAADEMITAGYPEGVKALKAVTADKTPKRASYDVYKSQTGFLPSVGDVVAGNPVNMYNVRKSVRATTKVVDVVIDNNYGCNAMTEEIERNAVEITTAVLRLEKSGYRVGLHILNGGVHYKNDDTYFIVTLKKSNQKIDIHRLSYPMLHPSFFRRHCFAIFERLNKLTPGLARLDHEAEKHIPEVNRGLDKAKFLKAREGKTADEIVKLVTE